MALIARILGVSLLTGMLGAGLGSALYGKYSDGVGISLLLACIGSLVGAVAGATREIVAVLRQRDVELSRLTIGGEASI